MPERSALAGAYGRSPFLAYWISRALRRRLKQNFSTIRVRGHIPHGGPGGILLYTNHPSWWDPAVFALVQHYLLPNRVAFGPIDATAARKYPFLKRAGFMALERTSPSSLRKFLADANCILRSGGVLWITAQGQFKDVRIRPLSLRSGIAHLSASAPESMIIPVAVEYFFARENRPEIAIAIGEMIPFSKSTVKERMCVFEGALTAEMDLLRDQVTNRDFSLFRTLSTGTHGMGGAYETLQRGVARLIGKKFDPRHRQD